MKKIISFLLILMISGISIVSAQSDLEKRIQGHLDEKEAAKRNARQNGDNGKKSKEGMDYFERANALFNQKKYAETVPFYISAAKTWEECLNIDGYNYAAVRKNIAIAYSNVGTSYRLLYKYDEALPFLTKSIGYDPENAFTYQQLGFVYEGLKQYDRAEEAYKQMIRIDPNNGVAYAAVGNIYYYNKENNAANKNTALYFYEKALARTSSFSGSVYDDILLDIAATNTEELKAEGYSSSRANPTSIAITAKSAVTPRSTGTPIALGELRIRIGDILKKIGWEADGNRAAGGSFLNNNRKTINLYKWANGTIYMGESYDGYPHGAGLIIAAPGEYVEEWPDCSVFAGNFNKGVAIGGIAYDTTGALIYGGMNFDGKGLDKVQPIGEAALKTFGSIKYPATDDRNRDQYIGEILNNKRHGYGMLIWKGGFVWIGNWSNDKQNGIGIRIYSNGSYTIEEWSNGEFVKEM